MKKSRFMLALCISLLLVVPVLETQSSSKFKTWVTNQGEITFIRGYESSGKILQDFDTLKGEALVSIRSSMPGWVATYVNGSIDNEGLLSDVNGQYLGGSIISTTAHGDGFKELRFTLNNYTFTYFVIFNQSYEDETSSITSESIQNSANIVSLVS